MHDSNAFKKRAKRTSISVACLGGGPGTDVLGVLDYFLKYKGDFEGQLDIKLYDRKDKWGTCWNSMKKAIAAKLQDPRVRVRFRDFDVIKVVRQNADIITMHHLMEEVYSQRDNSKVMKRFDYIIQSAKPGALFLYSGMYMFQVIHWVHELFLKNNCKLLTPDTKQPGQPQRRYWFLDTSTGTKIKKRIPYAEVHLDQEGDLKLFNDIRDNLKTRGYPTEVVSQRYHGARDTGIK
ncbi:hypothetical protein Bbelb_289660 [Branchiostoma belcheri]|nr:hypothetical protein Bbelb_289660 [Branchiostoma belcheri]